MNGLLHGSAPGCFQPLAIACPTRIMPGAPLLPNPFNSPQLPYPQHIYLQRAAGDPSAYLVSEGSGTDTQAQTVFSLCSLPQVQATVHLQL